MNVDLKDTTMFFDRIFKIGELIGGTIWKEMNNPYLIVEEIKVGNFHFPSNWGPHYRRFIIARIRNKGNERAQNCLAHLETPSILDRELKLHWVDTPYEPRRDSTKKIDLEPKEAIDLDLVFAVCGDENPKISIEPILYTGSVVFHPIEPRPSVTYDQSISRGTYDPSLYKPVRSDSNTIIDAKLPSNRKFPGAWIATPYALYDPDGYREVYLPPGKHEISVDILLSKGTGCGFSCSIESSEDPSKLDFNPETVKIPGI
jgi:hypothetical protein